MVLKNLRSVRDYVQFLESVGELERVKRKVDPIIEMAAIVKKLDGGPALLFENVKGYPDAELIENYIAKRQVAKAMGVEIKEIKFKLLEAIKKQIPPQVVTAAPSQEVVITKDLDIPGTLPLAQQTELETMPALGSAITLLTGKWFDGGSHLGFHRMHWRGKDFSSIQFAPGSHMDQVLKDLVAQKARVPITLNICPSIGVQLSAGSGFDYALLPKGCDELGLAGGIEGAPIEIVKAKTVDAYAIASSEWVIEGYVCAGERVWETAEAEKIGKQGVAYIHPEYTGYQGRAYRAFRFEATALTHRKQKRMFHAPVVSGTSDTDITRYFRESWFLFLADAIRPGFVIDCNLLRSMPVWAAVVFQVRKTWRRDDGFQRNILAGALGMSQGLRMAIAVDEDVDIYSADDVLWALVTRVNPATDIWLGAGGRGQTLQPADRAAATVSETGAETAFSGGLAIDATVPFEHKERFRRAQYAIDKVNLTDWLSNEAIARAMALMPEYERLVTAKKGI